MGGQGAEAPKDFGFYFMARLYPDLLLWALSEAKLRLSEQTTLMGRGERVLRLEPGLPFVYCPSVAY